MDTTYKEIITRIRTNFSSETMQVKRKWDISSEVLKEKKCQFRILHPTKILKEFTIKRHALKYVKEKF